MTTPPSLTTTTIPQHRRLYLWEEAFVLRREAIKSRGCGKLGENFTVLNGLLIENC